MPAKPETVPATARLRFVGSKCNPDRLSPTSASTKMPSMRARPSVDMEAITTAATTTPTNLPATAHLISPKSIERRSRCASRSVRTSPDDSRGPGINAGSMSISSGAPTNPRPKPMDPWSVAPRQTARLASTMSAQDSTGTAKTSVSKRIRNVVSVRCETARTKTTATSSQHTELMADDRFWRSE